MERQIARMVKNRDTGARQSLNHSPNTSLLCDLGQVTQPFYILVSSFPKWVQSQLPTERLALGIAWLQMKSPQNNVWHILGTLQLSTFQEPGATIMTYASQLPQEEAIINSFSQRRNLEVREVNYLSQGQIGKQQKHCLRLLSSNICLSS